MTNRKVAIRTTKDGGRNWGNWKERSLGEVGEYRKRVTLNRLGQYRTVSLAIRVTSPIKAALMGATAKVSPEG